MTFADILAYKETVTYLLLALLGFVMLIHTLINSGGKSF